MSVTPDEDDTEQDKLLSLVPKELWALYSTDIGRIHSACAIKITEEKEKPLPNICLYPLRQEATEGIRLQYQITLRKGLLRLAPGLAVAVPSLSRVRLFMTPRAAALQASLSFTISQSFLKLLSIESVMPSNHLILCHPLLLLPSQFSSAAQSCPTLCNPMNRSTPSLPVHYQLPEFTQTHVHRVGDAIQPSHPLSSPSPPAPNPSQHQGLFQ